MARKICVFFAQGEQTSIITDQAKWLKPEDQGAGKSLQRDPFRLSLRLTPHGHLVLEYAKDCPVLENQVAVRLNETFAKGSGYGLMWLGAKEVGQALPPTLSWWLDFAVRYMAELCLRPAETACSVQLSNGSELATMVLTAPMMPGAEYLNQDILKVLWEEIGTAFSASLAVAKNGYPNISQELELGLEHGRACAFQSG